MQKRSKSPSVCGALCVLFLLLVPTTGRAESVLENVFASISLDGKKIGQIHFTLKSAPTGEVEELRTNASLSVLGFKVYNFAQHLHETWRNASMQTLRSDADDNGTDEKVRVRRASARYDAERNGKPVDLPDGAFPDSIWHYVITKKSLLFNSVDLRLMKISVARKEETITHHGKSVAAERFDFTGDWVATLWYGKNQRLLKAHSTVDGRDIVIAVDADT